MKSTIAGLHIAGIATVLPEKVIKTDDYAAIFGEKKVRRIKRSTGVEAVHVVRPGQTASDLCVAAAEHLFEEIKIDRSTIDAIVFVSISPDYRAPGTAGILQDRLGLSHDVAAFDLTYGCSGYIYGIYQAAMLIQSGCRKVLVCAGDTQSTLVNEKDRSMKMLVGDSGTATLVEQGDDTMHFYFQTLGAGYRDLIIEGGACRMPSSEESRREIEDEDGNIRRKDDLFMDGMGVMKFSLTEVPKAMAAMYETLGCTKDDVDLFAYHQPNKLILDYLSNAMDVPTEKMPVGLQQTGNTAAASVPTLLSTLQERGFDFTKAEHIIASGFGIGLSIGAVDLHLNHTKVFAPVIVE